MNIESLANELGTQLLSDLPSGITIGVKISTVLREAYFSAVTCLDPAAKQQLTNMRTALERGNITGIGIQSLVGELPKAVRDVIEGISLFDEGTVKKIREEIQEYNPDVMARREKGLQTKDKILLALTLFMGGTAVTYLLYAMYTYHIFPHVHLDKFWSILESVLDVKEQSGE